MSGKDKRGSNSAPKGPTPNGKPPVQTPENFVTLLNSYFAISDRMRKGKDVLEEYGTLCDNNEALREELEEKDKKLGSAQQELDDLKEQKEEEVRKYEATISQLEAENKRDLHKFEQRVVELNTELERYKTDAAELAKLQRDNQALVRAAIDNDKEKARLRLEAEKSQQENANLNESISTLENQLQMRDLQMQELKKSLKKAEEVASEAESRIGLLHLEPDNV